MGIAVCVSSIWHGSCIWAVKQPVAWLSWLMVSSVLGSVLRFIGQGSGQLMHCLAPNSTLKPYCTCCTALSC